jgi:hypothetical protein
MARVSHSIGTRARLRIGIDEVQFPPSSAIADGDQDLSVLNLQSHSTKSRDEDEEVASRGIGNEKAVRDLVMDQFYEDLGCTRLSEHARGAFADLRDGTDRIEATTDGMMVLVSSTCRAEGEQGDREG